MTIRRQLATLAAKEGTQKAELKPLQEELRNIDSLSISPVSSRLSIKDIGGVILALLPLNLEKLLLTVFLRSFFFHPWLFVPCSFGVPLHHTLTCLHRNTHLSLSRKRVDGKFLGPGGIVPASQAICSSLLEECFDIVQEIKAREDSKNVGSSLKPIYDRLNEIRAELESLVMTHRWSLRETDLWNYSLSLQEIDKMRVDGKFVDSDGNMPSGQYVGFILINKASLLTIASSGSAIPSPTLPWSHLPLAILKRASI